MWLAPFSSKHFLSRTPRTVRHLPGASGSFPHSSSSPVLPSVAVPQRQASNLFSIYPHHLCKVSPTLALNTIHIRQPPKSISTRMFFDPQTQIALLCLSSKTLIPLHAQYSKHLVCSFWVFFSISDVGDIIF